MRDHISLGATPGDETCAQVGSPDYAARARAEGRAYVNQLVRKFGPPPEGASLRQKGFPHDYGTYYEVVVSFDDALPEAVAYAFKVEGDLPGHWDRAAKDELLQARLAKTVDYFLQKRDDGTSFYVHTLKKNPTRTFAARFPGTCSICQEPIAEGVQIYFTGALGGMRGAKKEVAHVECEGKTAAPPAPPKPRAKAVDPDPYAVRFVGIGVTRGGPWVVGMKFSGFGYPTEEAAQEESDRRRARDEELRAVVVRVASGAPRFGLPITYVASAADKARYAQPLSPRIERIPGGTYNAVEILRLLDRATSDAFPLVERMLDRMLEKQTQTERKMGTAIELNFQGFNKPDSYTAEKLKQEAAELKSLAGFAAQLTDPNHVISIHFRMASLLAKYVNTQLANMMNQGAKTHGVAMRTNRRWR
jgi:hypothetical protein